jgi:uncharacterized protein (DUF1499 family)
MWLLKLIVFVIVLAIGITIFTLYRNGANLFEEPGMTKRLGIFLTTHSAATSDNPDFEELRTPVFDMDAEKLYQRVLNTGSELGWSVIAHDSDALNVNLVVRSPVFLFEDDVYVQVKPINEKQSSLYVQSSSRTGRADFAANSGHIQLLIEKLKQYR